MPATGWWTDQTCVAEEGRRSACLFKAMQESVTNRTETCYHNRLASSDLRLTAAHPNEGFLFLSSVKAVSESLYSAQWVCLTVIYIAHLINFYSCSKNTYCSTPLWYRYELCIYSVDWNKGKTLLIRFMKNKCQHA